MTDLEKELVHNGYIVPRPEGVKQNTITVYETPMPEKNLYIAGAVFRPICETILPEIEDKFDFTADITVLAENYSIETTILPELTF